jgi:hypothetical protein
MNPQNLVRAVADQALDVQTWRLEGIVFCPLGHETDVATPPMKGPPRDNSKDERRGSRETTGGRRFRFNQ